jgi:hypothetical protein
MNCDNEKAIKSFPFMSLSHPLYLMVDKLFE